MPKVRIIKSDDWASVFVDGVFIYEGHNPLEYLISILEIDYQSKYISNMNPFWSSTSLKLSDEEFDELTEA